MELEPYRCDDVLTVEGLPVEIMENILSFLSYDEISIYRRVSRHFNTCCQRLLNQGFFRAERFHAQCLKAVKKQLPRRESERRTHPLARHCEILTSIETRLSLLSMTFMKYMDMNLCCFIPGKWWFRAWLYKKCLRVHCDIRRNEQHPLQLYQDSCRTADHITEFLWNNICPMPPVRKRETATTGRSLPPETMRSIIGSDTLRN